MCLTVCTRGEELYVRHPSGPNPRGPSFQPNFFWAIFFHRKIRIGRELTFDASSLLPSIHTLLWVFQTHINARGVLVFTAVFPFPMFVLTCLFAAGRIMHQVCQVCVCLCLGGRRVCSFAKATDRHGNSTHSAASLPAASLPSRRQAGRQAWKAAGRQADRQAGKETVFGQS